MTTAPHLDSTNSPLMRDRLSSRSFWRLSSPQDHQLDDRSHLSRPLFYGLLMRKAARARIARRRRAGKLRPIIVGTGVRMRA